MRRHFCEVTVQEGGFFLKAWLDLPNTVRRLNEHRQLVQPEKHVFLLGSVHDSAAQPNGFYAHAVKFSYNGVEYIWDAVNGWTGPTPPAILPAA